MPLFKKDPGKVAAKRDAQSSVAAHEARMKARRQRRKDAQRSINQGGGPGATKGKKGKK